MSSIAGLLLWRRGWWLAGLLGIAGIGSWLAADAAEVARPKAAPVVAAAEQAVLPEAETPLNGMPGAPQAGDPIWLRTSREAEEAAAGRAAATSPAAGSAAAIPDRLPARAALPNGPPASARRNTGPLPAFLGPNGQSTAREAADAKSTAAHSPAALTPSAPRELTRLPAVEAEEAAPTGGNDPDTAKQIDAAAGLFRPATASDAAPTAPLAGFSRGEAVAPAGPAALAEQFADQPAAKPAEIQALLDKPAIAPPATKPAAKPPAIQALLDKPVEAPPRAPQTQSEKMEAGDSEVGLAPIVDPATARKLLEKAGTLQVSATGEAGAGAQAAVFRPRPQAAAGQAQELRPMTEPAILNDRNTPVSAANPYRTARPNQPVRIAQVPPPVADPFGDDPLPPRAGPARPLPALPGGDDPMVDEGPFDVIEATGSLDVMLRRSLLLRTKADIYRTAVVDPSICDVVQFTPREVSIIGKGQGATSVTFWFNDGRHRPVTYIVRVKADVEERRRLEGQFKLLQDIIREQFPNSKVYLIPVADKLIVKGQARDAEEAAQIMAIIRGQTSSSNGRNQMLNLVAQGTAAQVLGPTETGRQAFPRMQVINMLRVPGVQQVSLRAKIAELNRSAARGFGVNVEADVNFGGSTSLLLNSMLNATTGGGPSLLASFDGDDVQVGIRYLQQRGVIRVLSEPTLVTMSGTSATFVAGGEFAVPTIVGSAGLNAVTTDFRAFGVILSFTPTVLDKDRIRLQVAPEFSQINSDNTVGGIPGLKVRAVTTTVEMREGQTLAIAGLLDDSMKATNIGDLPFLAQIFGRRDVTRSETELIILVSPELVHPMEPEEVPPLPGYDVSEPNDWNFFVQGHIEGKPTMEHRSTVWPRLRDRYRGGGTGMVSGPYGHGN